MIINGKNIASQIQEELREKLSLLKARKPALAMVLVGSHPASQIYVSRKAKACEEVGILSIRRLLPESISETKLLQEIDTLNENEDIDGILVQLPLPVHMNPMKVIQHISPDKDVDGLHAINAGKLLVGDETGFVPCTPLGIKVLLERSKVAVQGKHVVVVGRSNLVGKPIAVLLMQNAPGANATVTIAHSQSHDLPAICRTADILIAAMGKPQFIKGNMVKEGVVVVDVGINKVGERIVGDVDWDTVSPKCSLITPVPGGVGPMTIAMLLSNTLKAFERRVKDEGGERMKDEG